MSREAVTTISLGRCVAVWLAATTAALALVGWIGPDLTAIPLGSAFDALLVWGCEAAAAACALWLWLVTTVVALDALRGRPHAARTGVPAGVRRLVLGACGVALAGGAIAAPSYAAEHRPHSNESVLVGLPVPDRATALSRLAAVFAGVSPRLQRHDHPAQTSAPEPRRQVIVRSGDTLWSLAERTLPAGASDAAVGRRWHRLYALNRAVIGADPDLIVPGQRLALPAGPEEDL